MQSYKNIILVGTSHIAKESIRDIENLIEKENPDIIALELDKKRLIALLDKNRSRKLSFKEIRRIGIKGYLFSLIGAWAERKLGEKVGVAPGSDMLKAYDMATKNKKQIALIDQDIEITLKKLSKQLTWKEKFNFLKDIIKGLVLQKTEITFDLNTVPSEKIIQELIKKVKKDYPTLYKVVIQERNQHMAKQIAKISSLESSKKILAVIGAGHEKEMLILVKKYINTASY